MKDLPPRPEPPQPLITLPRELRLVQVGDALREAPDGDVVCAPNVRRARRRLFVDDEPAGEEGGGAGPSRRRARAAADPLAVYVLRPAQNDADKMAAEERAAASRRWNFDFENERPLEGQWQWEKVGDPEDCASDEGGDPQPAEPVGECHSPQR